MMKWKISKQNLIDFGKALLSSIKNVLLEGDVRRFKVAYYGTIFIVFMIISNNILLNFFINSKTSASSESAISQSENLVSFEKEIKENILGADDEIARRIWVDKIRTDVGFTDLRVLALEDYFNAYNSPLAGDSDEFIKAAEKYEVDNWQLLPAIAMAETSGCKTGYSHDQRNCWGWGGSEPNRWEFYSYAEAIDTITYRMKKGYGNNNLNPKDIQGTYCGRSCNAWGWRWAMGVDYYIRKLNDFAAKYGIERTNETYDWRNPPSA